MFTLQFTNTDGAPRHFETLDAAIAQGKAWGFEFSVWRAQQMLAVWTVFGGLRIVDNQRG